MKRRQLACSAEGVEEKQPEQEKRAARKYGGGDEMAKSSIIPSVPVGVVPRAAALQTFTAS